MRLGFLTISCLWLVVGCASSAKHPIELTDNVSTRPSAYKGPTLYLKDDNKEAPGNPIGALMYFVRLISDEPVIMSVSDGNTQQVRVLSVKRQDKKGKFTVSAVFEITGGGEQRNDIDHSKVIRAKAAQLARGKTLKHRLSFINIKGEGRGSLHVVGVLEGGAPRVEEFVMNFGSRGHFSPVTIGLHDIVMRGADHFAINGQVARVKSLAFRQSEGSPKMEATMDSVKPESAGNNIFRNFVGRVKGTVTNWFIPPISIKQRGNEAMLNFARAVAEGHPSFTFPPTR